MLFPYATHSASPELSKLSDGVERREELSLFLETPTHNEVLLHEKICSAAGVPHSRTKL